MKKYIILGHLTYVILIILAGIFHLERIIYTDASFYLFKMIHFDSFNIELGRYTSVFYEFLPLLAIKFGLPLNYLVFIFSLSTILFSYFAFLICLYFLKNETCAFTVLFLNFIGISSSFFYPMSELVIGLIFTVILFAWLEFRKKSKFDVLSITIGSLIISLCFLSHPGVIPALTFVIGYYIVSNNAWKNINVYILIIIFFSIAIYKTLQMQTNTYEANVMSQLGGYKEFFKNIFNIYSLKFYFYKYWGMYMVNNLVFIFTSIYLIKQAKYLQAAFYVMVTGGIFLFYLILYHAGESDVMMEKAFYPLTIFIFLPFLKELIFGNNKSIYIKLSFFVFIVVFGVVRFISESKFYSDRLAYFDSLFVRTHNAKNIYYFDQESRDKLAIPWATGVETLIFSSIQDAQNPKTIYFLNEDQSIAPEALTNPKTFLCVTFWPKWELNEHSRKYFKLPEETYQVMNPENVKSRDEKIQIMIENMKKDPKWLHSIELKAREKNISLDSMLILDAIWMIENK